MSDEDKRLINLASRGELGPVKHIQNQEIKKSVKDLKQSAIDIRAHVLEFLRETGDFGNELEQMRILAEEFADSDDPRTARKAAIIYKEIAKIKASCLRDFTAFAVEEAHHGVNVQINQQMEGSGSRRNEISAEKRAMLDKWESEIEVREAKFLEAEVVEKDKETEDEQT